MLPADTAGDLLARLARSGAGLLVATMDGIESGELAPRPQPADGVSLAPKITPAQARVDWGRPAMAIDRLIRACTPQPGAWTDLAGVRLKVWPLASVAAPDPGPAPGPGELRLSRSGVIVGTGSGPVQLGDVQPDGKRRMRAADWARGLRHLSPAGARLT